MTVTVPDPLGLTDAELLARALAMTPSQAAELLTEYGGLRSTVARAAERLTPSRGVRLTALDELARRLACEPLVRGARLDCPEQVYRALAPRLRGQGREHFLAVPLDVRHRIIDQPVTVAVGHLAGVDVHPREVLRPMIACGAARLIVAHNHPSSGDSAPSPQDLALTMRLRRAGDAVGIPLDDHVILGDGCWTSLRAQGLFDSPM